MKTELAGPDGEAQLRVGPSKPAHVRREDQLVTESTSVARQLVPKPDEMESDYPRQRIFYGSRLLAHQGAQS